MEARQRSGLSNQWSSFTRKESLKQTVLPIYYVFLSLNYIHFSKLIYFKEVFLTTLNRKLVSVAMNTRQPFKQTMRIKQCCYSQDKYLCLPRNLRLAFSLLKRILAAVSEVLKILTSNFVRKVTKKLNDNWKRNNLPTM